MNSNNNIMPVQFIPPPIVQFIPADPIFTDRYGRQMVYNVFYLGRHITTTVTHDPVVIHEWIFNVRRFNFHHIGSHVVGLAVQTPPRIMSSDRRPAIIELCIGQNCIIFRTQRTTVSFRFRHGARRSTDGIPGGTDHRLHLFLRGLLHRPSYNKKPLRSFLISFSFLLLLLFVLVIGFRAE